MRAYPKAKITTDYSSSGVGRWRASQQKKRRMTAWGLGSVKTIFEVVWRNINVSKRLETHVKFS
jgi:hypothetical protein